LNSWSRLLRGAGALTIACAARVGLAADNSDPLLDLLIKKGLVTQDEAEKVQAEADAMRSNNLATSLQTSKWKISNGIKDIELFGDLRGRFEDREAKDPSGGRIDLDRLRYAARIGLRGDTVGDFYYGLRLETAANPRSPWVDFGNSSSGSVPYQGPFGKSTSGINVGQLYLGWRPTDWLDLSFGSMPNPLYTTPMIWDTDLNPQGFAERFKYKVGQADFFATFGQFLYEDTNPERASSGYFFGLPYKTSDLPFLFAWQGGFTYHINPNISFKVAPVFYNYLRRGVNPSTTSAVPDFNGTFVGQGSTNNINGTAGGAWSGFPNGYYDGFTANQTGINDLEVIDIPGEFNVISNRMHIRMFGDYAKNLEGSSRAEAAYSASRTAFQPVGGGGIAIIPSAQTSETRAYQVGIGIGSTNLVYGPAQGLVYGTGSAKHAWELRTYWQHVEQYALDPNLVDSDFFEGRLNMQGLYAAASYSLTDNIIWTFRYGLAKRIDKSLGTGGSNQDIPQMNPIEHYSVLQADLTLRF